MSVVRVAVASEGEGGLEALVSGHFGRAPSFTLVAVEEGRIVGAEVIANPHAVEHKPGVVPKLVRSAGAQVILSGGMGPRARHVFQELGIEAAVGATGRVREAVTAWLAGKLPSAGQGDHSDHGDHHHGHGHGHGHGEHGHGHGEHHHGHGEHHHGHGEHHHGHGEHGCGGCGHHH